MKTLHLDLFGLAVLTLIAAGCAASTPVPTLPATEQAATKPTEVATAAVTTEEPTEALPTRMPISGLTFVLTEDSEARFLIEEVMFGAQNTVIGATHDVEGSIVPDFQVPANTSVGTILIDLSTLETDNSHRTRTMQNSILQTGNQANRYAEFVPKSISGLPESIVLGDTFTFQITGDLTIHGTTLEKTFDVTATAVSDTRIEGLARLEILYSEFGISILRLPPEVASVEDEVILELEFVAMPE